MSRKSLLAATLFVFAASVTAPAAEEVEYFAIFANGAKIGHTVQTRTVEAGTVTTTSETVINAERMGAPFSATVTQKHVETTDGKPLAFTNIQDLSIMSQKVEGTVTPDGKLKVVMTSGGQTQQLEGDWPAGALLSEGMLLLQKQKGLKEGIQYSLVMFDATMLRGLEANVRVAGRKEVDVLGHQEDLWEVINDASGVTVTSYVNDEYKSRKTVTAESGMNLEIVTCSKDYALGQNAPLDLVAKTIIASPVRLDSLPTAKSITYHLVPNVGAKLNVPAFDNQKVSADPSGLTVIVTAQRAPKGIGFPYAGTDPSAKASLKPSMYLESQRPEIVALARQALGATRDAAEAARRIERFVRNYITEKDFSVGYAPASEVVKTRRGDCTEHAVLAAAMCRAVGIPAQVVAGLLYMADLGETGAGFGPHAWVRVYIGNEWYNIDPTVERGYDLSHIAMASGDGSPTDYLGLIELMGAFRIDKIAVQSVTRPPAMAPQPR